MTNRTLLPAARDEAIARIRTLDPDAERQWGKLTLPGMLAHCRSGLEMALGERDLGRPWMGRLLGGVGKQLFVKNARPFGKGAPTDPRLLVADATDVERERDALLSALERYVDSGPDLSKPHPFFGPLKRDEWDHVMWKHLDHHLRQFSA